ncbi:MAG: hypothetical protein BGO25_01990 [Acidobacteriales bacterium 59-55]|mgnify:CR=1 FL=1|nr:hypothetical protein [Terriglobales bacterium]ODU54223.1 MAG: hypothetical protein ABT04_03335 [Granulicella sp. SCN 62-9]OJV42305.1 MAG: hypothetical protein BGO25_01990 [Acidobacteriales bacterium 59-55]
MTDYRVTKGEVQEDQITAAMEKCTAQVPSSIYLGMALASMGLSLGLSLAKKSHSALFVGQWAAPFLLIGIYNKIVKLHGSDSSSSIPLAQ